MSTDFPEAAVCPLPDCGRQLYLVRSFCIPVDDDLRHSRNIDPASALTEGWEVVCEEDHRLGSGDSDTDGRSALVGLRVALSLGGLR